MTAALRAKGLWREEGCGVLACRVTWSLEQTAPPRELLSQAPPPAQLPQAGRIPGPACWSWGPEPKPGLCSSALTPTRPAPRRGPCLGSTSPGPCQVSSPQNWNSWLDHGPSPKFCNAATCPDQPCHLVGGLSCAGSWKELESIAYQLCDLK